MYWRKAGKQSYVSDRSAAGEERTRGFNTTLLLAVCKHLAHIRATTRTILDTKLRITAMKIVSISFMSYLYHFLHNSPSVCVVVVCLFNYIVSYIIYKANLTRYGKASKNIIYMEQEYLEIYRTVQ